MRDLHQTLAWAIVLGNGLAGGWALAAHRVARLRHRALWVVTGLAQVLLLAQAWAGAALQARARQVSAAVRSRGVFMVASGRERAPEETGLLAVAIDEYDAHGRRLPQKRLPRRRRLWRAPSRWKGMDSNSTRRA